RGVINAFRVDHTAVVDRQRAQHSCALVHRIQLQPADARIFWVSALNKLFRQYSARSIPVGNQMFPAFLMWWMMPRSASVRPRRPMMYGCIVNGMYFGRSGVLSE